MLVYRRGTATHSISTADVPLKIQATEFDLEDDEDRNYFSNVVQFCSTVIITMKNTE